MACKSKSYEELQRQLNRQLDNRGLKLLVIDGDIGPRTISAIYTLSGNHYANCDEVARDIVSLTSLTKKVADAAGLTMVMDPLVFTPKLRKEIPTYNPATRTVSQPSIAQASFMGLPLWLLAVGVGGGILYKIKKRKK